MDNVITTRDLRKSFPAKGGRVEAVRGVSTDVGRGEVFGFLGPNSAGKTTTLRMLTTLLPIEAGSATVAGLDPQNRANLWDHVQALRDQGTTVFLTTHYLEEGDALCDRLMIIDYGLIVAEGTPRDLKKQVAGDSVVLSLRDDADAASRGAAAPRQEPYVWHLTADGGQLRLYVEDGGTALPHLLRLLDAERIEIRSVSLSERTLDDVFLRQTGRSLRDAGDGGGADSHGSGHGEEREKVA